MLEKQIELEKQMTQTSVNSYRRELERNKQSGNFGCTPPALRLISRVLEPYKAGIEQYLTDYSKGLALRSTRVAEVLQRIKNVDVIAYISAKTIFNFFYKKGSIQSLYKAIGQAIEDEYKMELFKSENQNYYQSIQDDLNKRGAKANRKKYITMGVFKKRLNFHTDGWGVGEKIQTGMVLVELFKSTTDLIEIEDRYENKKHFRTVIPTLELEDWFSDTNEKLEVMQPFFIPMVHPPKQWTSVYEGGYLSPYLRRNKFIKNNDSEYIRELQHTKMPVVYNAVNHLQNTAWQINTRVLDVARSLWEKGGAAAGLPEREDEPLLPYPENGTEDEVKTWKRLTYETHKRNVSKRSLRILTYQILSLAERFKDYDKIYFPYQLDFRGRIYPIPVLLQPQGSDLAKGLLQFSEGKKADEQAVKWLQIHGANMWGFDKESYQSRIEQILARLDDIKAYVANPVENLGWTKADKPFQFLAWCFEYADYLDNPVQFRTHIPVQLDGTCNGLQHYSALLRDEVGGNAVNLINAQKPHDIYGVVAKKLEDKLNERLRVFSLNAACNGDSISNSSDIDCIKNWLELGINRKLTKRPVMVLPYGGTLLSCREYIGEYLTDNYSLEYIFNHFRIGNNPQDCVYKVSVFLSKYLWESIRETLGRALDGMSYIRKIISSKEPVEWTTPAGLKVRQSYPERKHKEVKTELYGNILKTRINVDDEGTVDFSKQLNGICPNFIHSLDGACLMLYLNKCKKAGINSIMSVHDCYGTHAADTELSARFLREAFVEVYRQPILENFTEDVLTGLKEVEELPEIPEKGSLDIEEVLKSDYFFN